MYVSLTRVNTSDEPIENATIVGEEMVRWLHDIDGFLGFLMLSREESTLGLSFWKSREVAERHRVARMEFLGRITSVANVQVEEMLDFDVTFAELLEPLVADPEVVGNLVQHHAPDLAAQTFSIGAVEALERPAVDRDLVRQDAAVTASPSRQRNALIEPEQRLAGRWLRFDDDRDIGDDVSKLARKGRDCVLYLPLEVDLTGLLIGVH